MNKISDEFGDQLFVKLVIFEYKYAQKSLAVRLAGSKAIALSPAYFEIFHQELEKMKMLAKDLAECIQSNFIVEVQVNKDGLFNTSTLKCTFIKTLERKSNNVDKLLPLATVFYSVEKILPFAEYMHEIHLYSYQHALCNFEVRLQMSVEDIQEIFSYPFVAPRARQQWLDVMQDFERYACDHYTCSCCLPVIEGELETDAMIFTLSSREVFRRVK